MTDLQKLSEKGHLLGLETQWNEALCWLSIGSGFDETVIGSAKADSQNSEGFTLLLEAIEAKGYGFSVSTDYELDDPVEDRYSRDGFRVNIWHPKYDRDVDGKGESITEAVVKAALALCEELEP